MSIPESVMHGLQSAVEAKKAEAQKPIVEEVEEIEEEVEEQDDGYKSYEQYVADGHDPEFYRGKKAFLKQKEMIKELKDHKEKFRKLDEFVFEQERLTQKKLEERDQEIERLKKKAKEELDIDTFEALVDEQKEIKAAKKEVVKAPVEPDFISRFREDNPALNPAMPDFDEDYTVLFTKKYNKLIDDATQRAGRDLSEKEAASYLETVKAELDDKFGRSTKRPSRVTPTRGAGAAPKKDPLSAMPDAIRSQYERWLKDPKKKTYAEQMAKKYGA